VQKRERERERPICLHLSARARPGQRMPSDLLLMPDLTFRRPSSEGGGSPRSDQRPGLKDAEDVQVGCT